MFGKDHKINSYGTARVSEKGQIVIPAKARETFKIKAGDDFVFFGHGPILHLIRAGEFHSIIKKMTNTFHKKISDIKKQFNN